MQGFSLGLDGSGKLERSSYLAPSDGPEALPSDRERRLCTKGLPGAWDAALSVGDLAHGDREFIALSDSIRQLNVNQTAQIAFSPGMGMKVTP